MADTKYFVVPISMLQGMFTDSKSTANDILEVGVYVRALGLEGDSELDRLKSAAKFLGVSLGNPEYALNNAKRLYNKIPRGQPVTSINVEIVFEYLNNAKSEFDIACFCAYAGLKSILGLKSHAKITNDYLLARMFGFNSKLDLPNHFKNKSLFKRHSTRHGLDKLKTALEDNWGLKLYGRFMRGFYVSFSMSLENLVLAAEKSRKSIKEKQKRAEKKDIVSRVLQRLEMESVS